MMSIAQAVHLAGLPQPAARAFLYECGMTRGERERLCYIEGRTVEASDLAQAEDEENDALDDMRAERDSAQEEANQLDKTVDRLTEDLEAAEEKVLTLTTDLENAQDENEQLRESFAKAKKEASTLTDKLYGESLKIVEQQDEINRLRTQVEKLQTAVDLL